MGVSFMGCLWFGDEIRVGDSAVVEHLSCYVAADHFLVALWEGFLCVWNAHVIHGVVLFIAHHRYHSHNHIVFPTGSTVFMGSVSVLRRDQEKNLLLGPVFRRGHRKDEPLLVLDLHFCNRTFAPSGTTHML